MAHSGKTYVPKLVRLLLVICKYISRWRTQLRDNLTDEQQVLLDGVLTACEAFTDAVTIVVNP